MFWGNLSHSSMIFRPQIKRQLELWKDVGTESHVEIYLRNQKFLEWIPGERRKRGRPRKTLMEGVRAAMKTRHLEANQRLNRKEWCLGSGRRRQLSQDRKDRQILCLFNIILQVHYWSINLFWQLKPERIIHCYLFRLFY